VNHRQGEEANVNVLSFYWNHVLKDNFKESDLLYDIPNTVRNDGSAWFLDSRTGEIYYFRESKATKDKTDSMNYNNTIPIAGAVFYANKTIKEGQELFLDYKMKPPYPTWARDWVQ
jgi:SET domain-containing protein